MKNIYILLLLSLSFGTVTDIDGNVYETIQIGDQLWMAENLKVNHYNDGSEIPTGYSTGNDGNSEWANLSIGAYGIYNDNASNVEIYGNLYNTNAIDDERGLCPVNWHVPSNDDVFMILSDYLGGQSVAGGKGKTAGTIEGGDGLWYAPNTGATNESGLTVNPGGYLSYYGGYIKMGEQANFLTTTPTGTGQTIFRYQEASTNITQDWEDKRNGFSIRCLQDEITTGCIDPSACNYDETATADDGSCEYEVDCAGTCGGDLEPDCCGVCGGDNSQCSNCCGMPFPEDCSGVCCSEVCYDDYCGVCDDIPENDCVQDCAGTWGGDALLDNCGICDSDPANDCGYECGSWGGDAFLDECGVCNGDGPEEHHDCAGNCLVELDCAGNCCVLGEEGCYWQETSPCGEEGPSNGMDSCGVCGGR